MTHASFVLYVLVREVWGLGGAWNLVRGVRSGHEIKTKKEAMMRFLKVVPTALAVLASFSARAQDAPALYQQYCAQCHGTDLRGGNAASLLDGIWQFGDQAGYITRNIKNGITHLGMPGYGEVLDDAALKSLTAYLLGAEKAEGVASPPTPEELQTLDYRVKVEKFAEGLEVPWAVAFPDDDTVFITERPGRLRVVKRGTLQPEAVRGTPEVLNEGQGGLLDVAVDPDYDENGWVYLAYSHVIEGPGGDRPPAMTRLVRGHIKDNAWVDQEVIFEAPHDMYRTTRHHYGCRIVFDPEGRLYFSIGERGHADDAQDVSRPNGKIHRINPDGSIPADNPFAGRADAMPSIFTYGNRNPQGLAVHPETGRIWESEHGPMGGDEINLIKAGVNYGWPRITYGLDYSGQIVSEYTSLPGMEQPMHYYRPAIALCGLEFYSGEQFPKWNNRLLVGALKYEQVSLLNVQGERVIHEEVILKNAGRVRDVSCGPDGAVYVVLNAPDIVLRLTKIADRKY